MKCGICGKTTMRGNITGEQVPISGVYFLNRHKRTEHQAEYWAVIEARRAKAQATKQAKAAEAHRVSDARLQASKPIVEELLAALEGLLATEDSDSGDCQWCLEDVMEYSECTNPKCPGVIARTAITRAFWASPQAREEGQD